ncbi:DUF2459 domain-containing protein [Jannaschia sp. 2305UL9-9]|uniref:DUF2459 domain-containing protein n=1 Tax=Jannaschia sp. 2305UL9-9 TaxID=3121638 RepID=UPI003528EBC5
MTVTGPKVDAARSGPTTDIYLVGSAIHYDFLLPATPDVRQAFAFAADAGVPVAGADWILVGWGARQFYTATGGYGDMRPGPVWRAVTGDASVLRVDAFGPLDLSGQQRVRLNEAQVSALVTAIVGSTTGQLVPDTGFTATDAFFVGRGRFHLLRTCNVWIGEMLRAAGLPFGRWTPTPAAVRLSLTRLAPDQVGGDG